jgi:hypothetical protein
MRQRADLVEGFSMHLACCPFGAGRGLGDVDVSGNDQRAKALLQSFVQHEHRSEAYYMGDIGKRRSPKLSFQ